MLRAIITKKTLLRLARQELRTRSFLVFHHPNIVKIKSAPTGRRIKTGGWQFQFLEGNKRSKKELERIIKESCPTDGQINSYG